MGAFIKIDRKEIRKLDRIKRKLEKWTAKNNRQKSMEIIEELEKKSKPKKRRGGLNGISFF